MGLPGYSLLSQLERREKVDTMRRSRPDSTTCVSKATRSSVGRRTSPRGIPGRRGQLGATAPLVVRPLFSWQHRGLGRVNQKPSRSRGCEASLRNQSGGWRLSDHAICHGYSGAALIFAAAAQESGDAELLRVSNMLVDVVLENFNRDSKLGYRARTLEGLTDSFSLLEGAAGIGLSLLTLAGACDSSWMNYLGLPPLQPSPNADHALAS